jgi:DNA-binding transcriptional MerR regulator
MSTPDESNGRLRIGELARLSATTPRTIRHYHEIGILAEPRRDASDYRRYGPEHLIRLVRIRRLRGLGMSLENIGAQLGGEAAGPQELAPALRSLAADLGRQIESLQAVRQQVLDLVNGAAGDALGRPTEAWTTELRRHGLLEQHAELPDGERRAADLLDALHPAGSRGVIETATPLLGDPPTVARMGDLLARLRALADDTDDSTLDALAADFVALVPPVEGPPPIDVSVITGLIGDRVSPVQLRLMRRVRQLLDARQ